MINRQRRTRDAIAAAVVVIAFLSSSGGVDAQSRTSRAVPRTAWGDPDLQGNYSNSSESGIPMERPAEFAGRRVESVSPQELATLVAQRTKAQESVAATIGGTPENDTGAGPSHWYENGNAKNSRAWMISDPPDGKMPAMTDEALQRAAVARAKLRGGDGYFNGPFDSADDLALYVRCITLGVPGSMMPKIYGNSYQIAQGPGYVAIRYEMVHETRVIPLDSRPHVSSKILSYMGDARGRWEGDTLVVEATNFNEKSAFGGASNHLKTTERFRPTGTGDIEWSITFDDSHTWVRPWTFGMRLTRADSEAVYEYACHEGNEGIQGILKSARAEDREREAHTKP
jgi:hypothetical protein